MPLAQSGHSHGLRPCIRPIVGGVVGSLWALAGVILFYSGLMSQKEDIQINRDALKEQICALNYQKDEMALQREEYAMARKVFEQQSDTLKEQSKTSRIQQFESNFYSLLNVYIGIKNRILRDNNDFISDINIKLYDVNLDGVNASGKLGCISREYLDIYYDNKDVISHYLKTIYRIYRVIDDCEFNTEKEKFFYSKIVRSQFYEKELQLIYYNAHSDYGKNFRTLIIKYNILKHLNFTSKIETIQFRSSNPSVNSARVILVDWLDKFLYKSVGDIFDIESEEFGFSGETNVSFGKFIAEVREDDEQHILFKFHASNDLIRVLDLHESFDGFFEHYLCDRFFNSKFEALHQHYEMKSYDDSVEFKIKSDFISNIVKDKY
ncbi:putative phage abortive infection protein [Shewanella insulae]|uniref:putative phage abortive infection protein n=1 Tax=Shewanella insulae TaxID=2681496 RepID=UPI002480482A|nr:putative phage abortive infection protein [Shewanella insulae]